MCVYTGMGGRMNPPPVFPPPPWYALGHPRGCSRMAVQAARQGAVVGAGVIGPAMEALAVLVVSCAVSAWWTAAYYRPQPSSCTTPMQLLQDVLHDWLLNALK